MPVESIGEFGTPGASSEWIEAEGKLAIQHILNRCGSPPPEMKLEVVWQGHELGFYPEIGLTWEDPLRGVPWNYISRCEAALAAHENGGELPPGWTMPPVRDEDGEPEEEPFDPKKPPEPPDTLDFFEWQRAIGKLIEWSLDCETYQRNMPHLVESDGSDDADAR